MKGTQSTKPKQVKVTQPTIEEIKTTKTNDTTNCIFTDIVQTDDKEVINPTGNFFTNQTRNFPVLSS